MLKEVHKASSNVIARSTDKRKASSGSPQGVSPHSSISKRGRSTANNVSSSPKTNIATKALTELNQTTLANRIMTIHTSGRLKKPSKAETVDDCVFLKPKARAPRTGIARTGESTTLKKSSSYQNIKTQSRTKSHSSNSSDSSQNCTPNKRLVPKHHNSTNNLALSGTVKSENGTNTPIAVRKNANNVSLDVSSEPQVLAQVTSTSIDSQRNASRISVNTDLLSRVEKEKKQYEARISDLTQLTETRKMELEKLTFELRRTKKEAQESAIMATDARDDAARLRKLLGETCCTEPEVTCTGEQVSMCVTDSSKSKRVADKYTLVKEITFDSTYDQTPQYSQQTQHYSPPESLGTTTRMTAGGATSCITGFVTVSSASSEWDDSNRGIDVSTTSADARESDAGLSIDEPLPKPIPSTNAAISVANLQGQLLQMEEDNYTTTEELQATLQELCDLQRSLDEAHEENHSLAFERAILLESLCTQTTKLEHCRLQIDQLKQLLLTDRAGRTPESREANYRELYASIEQEKQDLLEQNNELAQSSDSLAQECRILTEKASLLQDSYDALENEHESLSKAYQLVTLRLDALKPSRDATGSTVHPGSTESSKEQRLLNSGIDFSLIDRGSGAGEAVTEYKWQAEAARAAEKTCQQLNTHVEVDELIKQLTSDVKELKERLQLSEAEHERQATEWRLYERDLLKTVQVADGIKAESEEEMCRMATVNHFLREQVKTVTDETNRLNADLQRVQASIVSVNVSSGSTANVPVPQTDKVSTPPPPASPAPTTSSVSKLVDVVGSPTSAGKRPPVVVPTTPTPPSSGAVVLPSPSVTASGYLASARRSSVGPSAAAAAAAAAGKMTPFHHHHFTFHHHHASPGGPGTSALSTGPTVRNLIQSIENQASR